MRRSGTRAGIEKIERALGRDRIIERDANQRRIEEEQESATKVNWERIIRQSYSCLRERERVRERERESNGEGLREGVVALLFEKEMDAGTLMCCFATVMSPLQDLRWNHEII